jgi:hypothetical protein
MPKPIKLFDLRMRDGSRQFLALPESVPWNLLRDHVAELKGGKVTGYLTDQITEVWIDFTFRGQKFTINNQFGEYWFFVKNPDCPAEILQHVAEHCAAKTGME